MELDEATDHGAMAPLLLLADASGSEPTARVSMAVNKPVQTTALRQPVARGFGLHSRAVMNNESIQGARSLDVAHVVPHPQGNSV